MTQRTRKEIVKNVSSEKLTFITSAFKNAGAMEVVARLDPDGTYTVEASFELHRKSRPRRSLKK